MYTFDIIPEKLGKNTGGIAMKPSFSWFNVTSLTLTFSFLYLPILLLVIYSFNESRLVTVWSGFSIKWYVALFQDSAFLAATFVTFKIAFISATVATVLGVLGAIILVRAGAFRGRLLFSGMIYAPLVMPEVITGLSLLLLFVSFGIERGFWTITLAHITFSMCYVTVVVSSRLVTVDRSLEEAATDLGCPPIQAFLKVILPILMPAILSAWLLAFTLSLDDLVIASFTSGPGATTLPMRIYSQVRLGVSPQINALSSLLIVAVTLAVVTVSAIGKWAEMRRRREEQAVMA